MSYRTKYTRQCDYVAYQSANSGRPLPANQIHADLNQVATATAQIVDLLKTRIRADGAIMNGAVGWDQLAAPIRAVAGDPTAVDELLREASDSADAAQ